NSHAVMNPFPSSDVKFSTKLNCAYCSSHMLTSTVELAESTSAVAQSRVVRAARLPPDAIRMSSSPETPASSPARGTWSAAAALFHRSSQVSTVIFPYAANCRRTSKLRKEQVEALMALVLEKGYNLPATTGGSGGDDAARSGTVRLHPFQ